MSVALKKMISKDLVSKSVTKPLLITITKKGISAKRITIKSMVKYKNLERSEKNSMEPPAFSNSLKKIVVLNKQRDKKREKEINLEIKTKTFNAFIIDAKKTIRVELIEYFEDKVPLDLIKDISLSISNKIYDMLFEYF